MNYQEMDFSHESAGLATPAMTLSNAYDISRSSRSTALGSLRANVAVKDLISAAKTWKRQA